MSISAISAAAAATRSLAADLPSLPKVQPVDPGAVQGQNGFGDAVVGALENLNELHGNADALAVQAATGDLSDVHEYTIAASQAEIATELTVAVRDEALAAFNDIMRMQV